MKRILDNPHILKIVRNCLDGFRVENFSKTLNTIAYDNILDVCCGLGEYSHPVIGRYVGIDQNLSYLSFARRHYPDGRFVLGDAIQLPFKDNAFEAALFAGTSHHFSNSEFSQILEELKRVSRKHVIVSDAVTTAAQNPFSRFFYHIDRGPVFRSMKDIENILASHKGMKTILKKTHRTFPGLYLHAIFVMELLD